MADTTDDDLATNRMPLPDWLEPVPSVEALPKSGVNEGAFCFVQARGEEATWQFHRGKWVRILRVP